MYVISYSAKAISQYNKLDKRLQKQVDKGIARISANPMSGKILLGDYCGIFSERVSTFRILYEINHLEIRVLIITIEHRKSVYGGH